MDKAYSTVKITFLINSPPSFYLFSRARGFIRTPTSERRSVLLTNRNQTNGKLALTRAYSAYAFICSLRPRYLERPFGWCLSRARAAIFQLTWVDQLLRSSAYSIFHKSFDTTPFLPAILKPLFH
jgi:hypothetical protein